MPEPENGIVVPDLSGQMAREANRQLQPLGLQSGEVIDATEQVVGCDIERVREKTQIIEGWFPSTGFKMRNRRRLKISAFGKLALTESSVLSCTAETVRKHF